MNMRKRLTELIQEKVHLCKNCVCVECDDYNGDRDYCLSNMIADHIIANGGILTPCKFLQKCFVIPTVENRLTEITEMKCIGFSLSHDSYNANLITEKNKLFQPSFGEFGKTVFLSMEAAKTAMGGIKR